MSYIPVRALRCLFFRRLANISAAARSMDVLSVFCFATLLHRAVRYRRFQEQHWVREHETCSVSKTVLVITVECSTVEK